MILEVASSINNSNNNDWIFIPQIIVISVFSILSIITVIKMIYNKKNYIITVSALITNLTYHEGIVKFYPLSPDRSPLTESSEGGWYYSLEYDIDGKKYKRDIHQGISKQKVGDLLSIKCHKNDYYCIRKSNDKTEILLLVLFLLFVVANTVLLIIFK